LLLLGLWDRICTPQIQDHSVTKLQSSRWQISATKVWCDVITAKSRITETVHERLPADGQAIVTPLSSN
jgi:hypothetical protein